MLRPVDCYKGCSHPTTNHDPSLPVSHSFKLKPIFQVPMQQRDILLLMHAGVHGSLEDLSVVTKFAVESAYFFFRIFFHKLLCIFLQYAVMQRL